MSSKQKRKQWSELNINPIWGCYNNPINGGPCWYCYASNTAKTANKRRTKVGFCELCEKFVPHAEPHLTPELKKISPNQKPKIGFVDGHYDWCGRGIKKEWLAAILERITECSQHTFPILSKFPERYDQYELTYPSNVMLGATVTNEGKDTLPAMTTPFKATPNPTLNDWKRIGALMRYKNRKVVSFEPLLGPLPEDVSLAGVDWVVIGSLSIERLDEFGNTINRNRHVQPLKEWVNDIVQRSKALGIPVFMKKRLTGFGHLVQQYPN